MVLVALLVPRDGGDTAAGPATAGLAADRAEDTSVAAAALTAPEADPDLATAVDERLVVEPAPAPAAAIPVAPPALPADSGQGRRIVFAESLQRVWLVDDAGAVVRTYPVSGSRYDNLQPGTYAVYSRSRNATAFDGSGSMEYFVRFTRGENAAIGFHTIPVYRDGTPEQGVDQLGLPLSAGCIRQAEADAIALWEFGQVGTTVVVTA